jgi:Tfp pilus assembly protein PilF
MYVTPERAVYNSAEVYRKKGELDRAEEQYRQTLRLNQGYGPACTSLASLLFDKGRTREAEDSLVRCLQAVPDYVEGWMQLGRMYVAIKRPSAAADAFRKVLSISEDPDVRKQASGYLSVIGVGRR